ncbi:MAG: hypothetical protein ACJ79K_01210 [Gemmatimonadaceae bacterium]
MSGNRRYLGRFMTISAIALTAIFAACQDGFSPGPVVSSMVVVRQNSPSDTVHAPPSIVVLRIFNASAQPAANVPVEFRTPIVGMNGLAYVSLFVGADTANPASEASYLTTANTDDGGFVAVAVARGAVVGQWPMVVTSPVISHLRDSVIFAITPGAAAATAPIR